MSKFPKPCEDSFLDLSVNNPNLLIEWIQSGELGSGQLTIAAEILGNVPTALPVLYDLTAHPSPMVREGAIYGLLTIRDEINAVLERLATLDPSPGVKSIAAENLPNDA